MIRSDVGPVPRRPPRSNAATLLISSCLVLATCSLFAQDQSSPLRRAYVPLDRPDAWPAGDWAPVPIDALKSFLLEHATAAGVVDPLPCLELADFQAVFEPDVSLSGTFTATVVRPPGSGDFLELGPVTPVLTQLAWPDGPAVWGTSPEGRVLLAAPRSTQPVTGHWSLAGRSLFGRTQFDVVLPPADSTRCRIVTPAGWRFTSSAGIVTGPQSVPREPGDASPGSGEQAVWTLELGRQQQCTWFLEPAAGHEPAPSLQCDRTLAYTLRTRGCRVQADFVVHSLTVPPEELVFLAPRGLTNPTVTYSSANIALPSRSSEEGELLRIAVPLEQCGRGRLGTFRVSGDLPQRENEDWLLPDVALQSATILRGSRRISVDRPLTLLAVSSDGLRESSVNSDDLGASWNFEDLRPDGRLSVRVGRPQTLLSAVMTTSLWAEQQGVLFHAVAHLDVRAGSTLQAAFDIPPGWEVIDVGTPAGAAGSGVSRWRLDTSHSVPRLRVDFRQALQPQSSKQIEILGRLLQPAGGEWRLPVFPVPVEADRWELLLAVRPGAGRAVQAARGLESVSIGPAGLNSVWTSQLATLKLSADDGELSWFRAESASEAGELVIGPVKSVPGPEPAPGEPAPTAADRGVVSAEGGPPPVLALSLRSIIADSGDLHEARYTLTGRTAGQTFEFQLDGAALFDTLLVDGQGHSSTLRGQLVELAPLPPGTREILVVYRTSGAARSAPLRRQLHIPLPRWNVPVEQLAWTVHLPPDRAVLNTSLSSAVWIPEAAVPWTQSVFSPLTRDAGVPRFDPLSPDHWRALGRGLIEPEIGPTSSGTAKEQSFISRGPPPDSLLLEIWNVRDATSLAGVVLFAALILVAALRRVDWSRWAQAACAAAAAALLAALAVPACYVPLAGGLFVGLLVGMLLPASWIARRDVLDGWRAVSERASRHASGPVAVASLLLAWLACHPPAQSQDTATPPTSDSIRAATAETGSPAGTNTDEARTLAPEPAGDVGAFDVLIPYVGAETGPVGYLARTHLQRFRDWYVARHSRPAYLLRSARYELDPDDAAVMRVEIDLVVLSSDSRVPVMLPFGDVVLRNPDDCLVDGQREQIRPAISGNGIVVEVDGASVPADRISPAAGGGDLADVFRTTSLTLWLRAVSADPESTGPISFSVPPILDTQLVLPAGDERRPDRSYGAAIVDDAGRRRYRLGMIDHLRLRPDDAEFAPGANADVAVHAVSMIEVHPLRMQVRTELQLSAPATPSGPAPGVLPRTLQLRLPRGAEVRQVASESLRGFDTWHAEPHATVLNIHFARAPAPGHSIEIDYTAPLEQTALRVEVPPIPLLPENGVLSHRIGLRAAPGLLLEPERRTLPAGRVHELLPDLFSAGLSTAAAWPTADAAFSVPLPTSLPVQLSLLNTARSVALQQTITIERGLLRLEAVAQVEVSGGRAYRHEFSAPPDLRIDSVAVVQDGANRLRDWARQGDRVVLHLQEGRSGVQEVRVTGWMPLTPDTPTPFPFLMLVDVDVRVSELLLRNAAGEAVALTARDGAPIEPGFDAPDPNRNGSSGEVRRYVGAVDFPASCRVVPHSAFTRIDAVTRLTPRGRAWTQVTSCRVLDRLPGREHLELRIPPALQTGFELRPAHAPASSRDETNGDLDLLIHLPDDEPTVSDFDFLVPLDGPVASPWKLPLPVFPGVSQLARYLVLPADAPFVPQDAKRIPLAEVDPELRSWWERLGIGDDDTVFQLAADEATLVDAPRTSFGAPVVSLLESVIFSAPGKTTFGRTTLFLSTVRGGDELGLVLPTGATLLRVAADAFPLETRLVDGHTVVATLAAGAPRAAGRVVVDWQQPTPAALTIDQPFPRLATAAPVREFVVLVLPREAVFIPRGDPTLVPREVYLLERSEQLLELIGGHADPLPDLPPPLLADLARDLDHQLGALATVSWSEPALRNQFEHARDRWASLRAADWITPLGNTDPAHAGDDPVVDADSALRADGRFLVMSPMPADSPHAAFWRFDRRQVRIAFAVTVIALLLLGRAAISAVLRRVVARRPDHAGRWRLDMNHAGLLVLGMVWWLWLRGSPLGLLLAAAALVFQTARVLRPAARSTGQDQVGAAVSE